MGFLSHLFYPWGFLLQGLAIVHFIRRRPDTYWLFIILFLGPVGAAVYIFVEVLPDVGLLRQSFKVFPRRKRIGALELAIRDNPSAGNWEELGCPCLGPGEQVTNTFNSQSTFILPVQGRADAFIFMADRWNPANAIDGRYVWLPVEFKHGVPTISWHDEWDLSLFGK